MGTRTEIFRAERGKAIWKERLLQLPVAGVLSAVKWREGSRKLV